MVPPPARGRYTQKGHDTSHETSRAGLFPHEQYEPLLSCLVLFPPYELNYRFFGFVVVRSECDAGITETALHWNRFNCIVRGRGSCHTEDLGCCCMTCRLCDTGDAREELFD